MPIIGVPMTKQQAIEFFGSQAAVAKALGIKQPSVAEWGLYPPEDRQLELHRLTGGKLAAEPSVLERYGLPLGQSAAAA